MIGIESARITFHNIKKCGFYKWNSDIAQFGSVEDILNDLKKWTFGVELSKTKLGDSEWQADAEPVYLAGILKKGADWVFATWNEVPSHTAGVASISSSSTVGTPTIHLNEVVEGSIPGYATYFWVLPDLNIIASLRFKHRSTGQHGMATYIEQFMSASSSYVVIGPSEDDKSVMKVVGYSNVPTGKSQKLHPYFRISPVVKAGEQEHILQNHARIRKVIRRRKLTAISRLDRSAWTSFVRFMRGAPKPASPAVDRSVYMELEYTPTLAELRGMIEANEAEMRNGTWDDMGFVFSGQAEKKYWLGKSYASEVFDLTVNRINEELIDLESLISELHNKKELILQLLNNDA